jgi:assimilatory nitrate reductase catalytic subunit
MPPLQWPLPAGSEPDNEPKRFFGDGNFFTPSGRGRFIAVRHRPPASATNKQFPLTLNTGRIRDQWHSMTRTGLSARLSGHLPQPFVSVHPEDALRFHLKDGQLADITSAQGSARVRVQVTDQCRPGQIFMPMHWNQVNASSARACSLIAAHTDPISGQPESKHTPVNISPWYGKCEAVLVVRDKLSALNCDYWAEQKVEGGYLYFIESGVAPVKLGAYLRDLCNSAVESGQQWEFGDEQKGEFRYALVARNQLQAGYALATRFHDRDYSWLGGLLDLSLDPEALGSLLRGIPTGRLAGGKTVCACKQVGLTTLCHTIRAQGLDSVAALGAATGAGTGCGSCIPELEQLLVLEGTAATAA